MGYVHDAIARELGDPVPIRRIIAWLVVLVAAIPGIAFLVGGVEKLADPQPVITYLQVSGPAFLQNHALASGLASMVALWELGLGLAILLPWTSRAGSILTLITLGAYTTLIFLSPSATCPCLRIAEPLVGDGTVGLVLRNLALALCVAVRLIFSRGGRAETPNSVVA